MASTASNVLTMLSYALRDPSNCCDISPALRACSQGLEEILSRAKELHRLVAVSESQASRFWFEELVHSWSYIEKWCINAERVLRERTADSFDDLFSPSDNISSSRGSLQKVLYIADNLIYDFHKQACENLGLEKRKTTRFSTVFDPQSAMSSEKFTGIINIPIRHAFSLHLLLPQLWHEVGIFIFHEEYPYPLSSKMESRVRRLSKSIGHSLPRDEIDDLLRDTADKYADLIVAHFGFGDHLKFVKHLTMLFVDAVEHADYPPDVQEAQFQQLLTRVFYTLQSFEIKPLLKRWARKDKGSLQNRVADKLRKKCLTGSRDLEDKLEILIETINTQIFARPRFSGKRRLYLPKNLCSRVGDLQLSTKTYTEFLLEFQADFLCRSWGESRARIPTRPGTSSISKNLEGKISNLRAGQSVTGRFRKAYLYGLEQLLASGSATRRDSQFRLMGSLGREAILNYYSLPPESQQ